MLTYYSLLSISLLSPLPLCIHFQSQTSAAGQGDVQLNPEEFTIGETTGDKLIAFLGVQSAPACLVNSPPLIPC